MQTKKIGHKLQNTKILNIMRSHFKKLLYAVLVVTFFGCDMEENLPLVDSKEQAIESNSIDPRFIRYLETIGFSDVSESDIFETKDAYVVQGDINFSKAELIGIYDEMGNSQGQNLQLRYSLMVSTPANQITIFKYTFDSSIPSHIRESVNEAFANWNSIRNFKFRFEEVSTGVYNTLITSPPTNSGAFAEAQLPIASSGGSATIGSVMRINISLFNGISHAQRVFISAHEIGHLVGLLHTDEGLGTLIPGTFYSDPNSIMNSGSFFGFPVPSWTNFSYLDLLSVRYYYSYDTSEKPFYSYLKNATGGFNWTTNWNLYQYGASGFTYWGINGYIYSSSKSGTVPLYRYRNNITQVDYLSLDPNLSASFPSYIQQEISGYVFTSSSPDRTPVYEWYHPNKGFHFTTLTNDGVISSGGWTGGGIAFYALKLDEFN
ncbi:MAG: M57 family metalloprotease [Algoriphagus aquaeductus]|uniref:M57 family metalloprotease n=1 Tax=Algoriphagus aquaeductus TaxID=475299 RepID=UPI00391D560B